MSKFLKKISELTKPETPEQKKAREEEEALANIVKNVAAGTDKDPVHINIARKKKKDDDDMDRRLTKQLNDNLNEAGPEDFVPRTPPGGAAPPPFVPSTPPGLPPVPGAPPGAGARPVKADPLTTEGETWLVNLARKALFIDIDTVGLTDGEREMIAKEVTPKNAKKVAKVIHKINVNYGLSEKFDSKIGNLIEDFKKKPPGA